MKKRFGLLSLIGVAAVLGLLLGAVTALAVGSLGVLMDAEVLVADEAPGTTLVGVVSPELFAAVEKVVPVPAVLEVAVAQPPDSATAGAGIQTVETVASMMATGLLILALALILAGPAPLTRKRRTLRSLSPPVSMWISGTTPTARSHILTAQ